MDKYINEWRPTKNRNNKYTNVKGKIKDSIRTRHKNFQKNKLKGDVDTISIMLGLYKMPFVCSLIVLQYANYTHKDNEIAIGWCFFQNLFRTCYRKAIEKHS